MPNGSQALPLPEMYPLPGQGPHLVQPGVWNKKCPEKGYCMENSSALLLWVNCMFGPCSCHSQEKNEEKSKPKPKHLKQAQKLERAH